MKRTTMNILTAVTVIAAVIISFVAARVVIGNRQTVNKPTSDTSVSETALSSQTTLPTTTTTEPPATTAPITVRQTVPSEAQTTAQTTVEKTTLDSETDFDFKIIDVLPLSLSSGSYDVRHCQGMAIDIYKGFVYYSYTNTFVKCDLEGNVVGSITGIKGHLGDACLNESDGKVYASYNPPGKKALYTAIIDVDNLNKVGLKAVECGLIRTVHLKEVFKDFSATVKIKETQFKRKYGVSGTDGVAFGPSFSTGKGNYLTVACGLTPQTNRSDNNYQILIQYNVKNWWDHYSRPLSFTEFHHSGPDRHNGKFFIYTGNTNYGVQTMTYCKDLNLWFLNVYPTTKNTFKKYNMYIVDGDVRPWKEILKGQPERNDEQYVLALYQDGEKDKKTGIYGWYASLGNKGMTYISDGLFYIIHPFVTWYKRQTAVAYLYVWDPDDSDPFTLAAGVDNNYNIGKKKPYVPPPTTKPPTTAGSDVADKKPTKKPEYSFNVEDIFSVFS